MGRELAATACNGACIHVDDLRHFIVNHDPDAVLFDEDYEIVDAVLMPHEVIEEYATFRSHPNGHVLHLKGPILDDQRVKDIKKFLVGSPC